MRLTWTKWLYCVSLTGVAAAVFGQDGTLTLEQALQQAKDRNGTVKAAFLNVSIANSELYQAEGKFFPTLTPSYTYSDSHSSYAKGVSPSTVVTNGAGIVVDWQLLDSGQRLYGYDESKANLQAIRFSYVQTLRQALFSVHQQYFAALEAQELLVVAQAQVKRTSEVLQQTKDFAQTGQGAKLAIYQADADYQNAKVQALLDQNAVSTAEATLKATIGWDKDTPLPKLATSAAPDSFTTLPPLEQVMKDGLKARADLQSERKQVESQHFAVELANSEALATWSLDANYARTFVDDPGDVTEQKELVFSVSLPWFDGNQTHEAARQALLTYRADQQSLIQAERAARADIESAYRALQQDFERVTAAKSAQDAAQQNYTATSESFRLGASTLIDVLTAQVTLETAQSDYIQAIYDYYTAEVQLKLSTGQPLPGEAG
jgi:outer membrane protein